MSVSEIFLSAHSDPCLLNQSEPVLEELHSSMSLTELCEIPPSEGNAHTLSEHILTHLHSHPDTELFYNSFSLKANSEKKKDLESAITQTFQFLFSIPRTEQSVPMIANILAGYHYDIEKDEYWKSHNWFQLKSGEGEEEGIEKNQAQFCQQFAALKIYTLFVKVLKKNCRTKEHCLGISQVAAAIRLCAQKLFAHPHPNLPRTSQNMFVDLYRLKSSVVRYCTKQGILCGALFNTLAKKESRAYLQTLKQNEKSWNAQMAETLNP